jgi:hypothetical protein
MRVRIDNKEVAAAFVALARLRPDVVLFPAPSAAEGDEVFDVGLIGSFDADQRATEVATLVRAWAAQLGGAGSGLAVEGLS